MAGPRIILVYVATATLLCTACAGPSTPSAGARADAHARATDAAPASADALQTFLVEGLPGESAALDIEPDAPPLVITIERDYYAASGKPCRRLVVSEGDATPAPRVACRDPLGAWRLLPRLRNRDLSAVTGGSAGAAPTPEPSG